MTEQELARDLGFLEAYTLGLGTMIGAGIFVLPGIVAGRAGPASMVAFAIGGIVALLAALSLSELATGMPKAGGSYYYVNRALGGLFGSIVGWGMWAGLMFASAFYMLGFGQYLMNAPSEALPVVAAALAMSLLLVAINYRGVKETGSLQNVIVITLVGLILVFITVGLTAVDTALLTPFAPAGWGAVGITAGTVFVTFIGFEVIATSAEEIRHPGRNLPLSMIAAVVTPTILYVLVMLVSTGVVPVDVLEASSIPVADAAAASVAGLGPVVIPVAGEIPIGWLAAGLMIMGAVLATVSSANASILSAARVSFAMGRDRLLTDWLNQVHRRYRTPYRAIAATGLVILVFIASPLPIATLADVAAFMFLITYALVHVSVVVLRRAEPEGYDPDFRIPDRLYPAVPVVGGLGCVAVMIQMQPVVQLIGLGIVALGVLWYAGYAQTRAISTSFVGEALAPAGEPENEIHRVVVGVANPQTEKHLIRYAAASAFGHDGKAELVAVNVIEVPPQTSPEQIGFEKERVDRQRELLDSARTTAEELGLPLRTRGLVGRDAGRALLSVIQDEEADHVVLGWGGPRGRRDVIFGSTLDPVIERAPCEVTLVTRPSQRPGRIVALAGGGPNAPAAVERSRELTRTFSDASLTLLNVQPRAGQDETGESVPPAERGAAVISSVAEAAGLVEGDYESRVEVADDVRATLLEGVRGYDTVCLGATGERRVARLLFGSIPQAIVEQTQGTVVIARGPVKQSITFRQALVERMTDFLESE